MKREKQGDGKRRGNNGFRFRESPALHKKINKREITLNGLKWIFILYK